MYVPDLTIDTSGYEGSDPWNDLPVKAIGWMEPPHPLPTGDVPPGFVERLSAFCTWDRLVSFEGGHQDCEFCHVTYDQFWRRFGHPIGNGQIRVLGDGVVYAAPSMVGHYVAVHRYLPPTEFIDAVMRGPRPDARVYVQYRMHWWEDVVNHVRFETELAQCRIQRRPMRLERFPPPGSTFGPLIRAYRRWYWTLLLMLGVFLLSFNWRFLPVTVPTLAALAFLLKRSRDAIACPLCRKPMAIPFREPKRWSAPCGVSWAPYSTMYCLDCGIGLRSSEDLWGAFKSPVVTSWA